MKKPDSSTAQNIMTFTPKPTIEEGVDRGRDIARVGEQLAIEGGLARHPKPIAHGIDDEGRKDGGVGHEKSKSPGEFRALQAPPGRVAPALESSTASVRPALLTPASS